MSLTLLNPESLGAPKGYSNGILAPSGGRLLFIAGQVGWNKDKRIVGPDFTTQFERALDNVLTVVREAGGTAKDIARMNLYVTDKEEYLADLKRLGTIFRRGMNGHYPAMALIEVQDLLEPGAKVEIEATAVLP